MFRPLARAALRRQIVSTPVVPRSSASSRTLFTSAKKPRSTFKNTVARWALAGGIVYYYATYNIFAEEPKFCDERLAQSAHEEIDERPKSLLPEVSRSPRRATLKFSAAEDDRLQTTSEAGVGHKRPSKEKDDGNEQKSIALGEMGLESGTEELEEEAEQEGAFNPETGEINWDCPCLGGMAHGPCGENFKAAFSCFVYSEAEPKGVDCIDKFKAMQACFQEHPDIYGAELSGDDETDFDKLEDSPEPLEVLDPADPEHTRSPATSAVDANENQTEDDYTKPGTEPVDAKKKEEKVAGTKEGQEPKKEEKVASTKEGQAIKKDN